MSVWVWLFAAASAGDKDKDGISNKVDACIDAPEDKDDFQDDDGCPDPDNDADGILDDADRCSNEPEDKDDFEDDDGCPDPDNDADGVPDATDRCPDESEDADDADGCATVTLQLLTESGWMAAIATLNEELLNTAGDPDAPCKLAASAASRWLTTNDPDALAQQWRARLDRAGADFDRASAELLLGAKGEVYRSLAPALDLLCKTDPSWSPLAPRIAEIYAALPTPPPPPKKKRR